MKPKMAEFDVQCQTSFFAASFEVTDRAEENNVRALALDVKRPPFLASLPFMENNRSYSRYSIELSGFSQ